MITGRSNDEDFSRAGDRLVLVYLKVEEREIRAQAARLDCRRSCDSAVPSAATGVRARIAIGRENLRSRSKLDPSNFACELFGSGSSMRTASSSKECANVRQGAEGFRLGLNATEPRQLTGRRLPGGLGHSTRRLGELQWSIMCDIVLSANGHAEGRLRHIRHRQWHLHIMAKVTTRGAGGMSGLPIENLQHQARRLSPPAAIAGRRRTWIAASVSNGIAQDSRTQSARSCWRRPNRCQVAQQRIYARTEVGSRRPW